MTHSIQVPRGLSSSATSNLKQSMDIFKKKSWCPSGVLESLVGKAADWQQCTADCTERIGKGLHQNVVIFNYGDQVRRYFALEYDCCTCTESCLSICPLASFQRIRLEQCEGMNGISMVVKGLNPCGAHQRVECGPDRKHRQRMHALTAVLQCSTGM